MRLKEWIESRQKPGTIADVARRLVDSSSNYGDVEKAFRTLFILEALVRHGGEPQPTAAAIGVHPMTVKRVVWSLGISEKDVQRLAERLRGSQ